MDKLSAQQAIREAIERIHSGKKDSRVLRPDLLREEVEVNPFAFKWGLQSWSAVATRDDKEITANSVSVLAAFADYVKANPKDIKGIDDLVTYGITHCENALSNDSTPSRKVYLGLKEYTEITSRPDSLKLRMSDVDLRDNTYAFDEMEARAKNPRLDMSHLSWLYKRREYDSRSEKTYFSHYCRYDLAADILRGLEFGFETKRGKHYIAARPLYQWQKAWDIKKSDGDGGSRHITLFDASGRPL